MGSLILVVPTGIELMQWIVGLWIGFELIFYFIIISDWKRSMDELTPTPKYRISPEVLIANIFNDVENLQNYDVTRFLEGWFLGAELSDVKRGNIYLDVCVNR
jgi:hypothetical protein